jgi:hypothetical protein
LLIFSTSGVLCLATCPLYFLYQMVAYLLYLDIAKLVLSATPLSFE